MVSITPDEVTEEIYQQINHSNKIHKLEKAFIEGVVKDFVQVEDNGCWYAVAHNYMNYLCNQLGKRIIESAHKRIEVSQNHNYAGVFNSIKHRIGGNLMNLVKYYTNLINLSGPQSSVFTHIR